MTIIPSNEGLQAADVIAYVESGGTKTFTVASEDPATIAARIDAQIFTAGSIEELLGGREVIHARDYLNKPFSLTDVEFRPSSIEGDGLPFYAVLHIVDTDGAINVVTTGARSVCMKLAKIKAENWLPVWLRFIEAEKTANGYTPLDIVAAPQGF